MNSGTRNTHPRKAGYLAAAAAMVVLLSACSRSATPADGAGTVGNGAWTTLGTRAKTSESLTPIASNADASWVDYNPPDQYPGAVQLPLQYITMADGIKLAAYVYVPADADGNAMPGAFPVTLMQTGYNGAINGNDSYVNRHGYATVVVDVRGTGQSEGSWDAFGPGEQGDFLAILDWVAQQPFSDGRIGLFGQSYVGITAILAGAKNHPAVKAVFAEIPIGDAYRDTVFTGGQVSPVFIPAWLALVSGTSLAQTDIFNDPSGGLSKALQHLLSVVAGFQVPTVLKALSQDPEVAYDGDFWGGRSPLESDDKIRVPTFIVGGAHDIFQRGEPLHYEQIKAHAPAKLLIGPWFHVTLGAGLPADGVPVLNHILLQWFDQYVKGMSVGADRLPNVTQYVLGHDHYVTSSDWPHPAAHAQRLYLRGDKSLSAAAPADGEKSNVALQVPVEGICSISLEQWTAGLMGYLPLPCFSDDGLTEQTDVVYETPVLEADSYINGPIEADIWMSTTALDAGLSVRVNDVDADGNVVPLTNGIQTASLGAVDATRSRTLDGQMIQPWHPYTQASAQTVGIGNIIMVPVEVFPTSAMIAKGHRLRIAIGASDLPQGVPPLPTLLQELAGLLTIYSDAAHPSSAVIPMVPASVLN